MSGAMGGAGTPRDVCIVGAARTPCGGLLGSLASIKAPALAGIAIREAVVRAGIRSSDVEEVILGHVLSAGVGQAPAKQAAMSAGLPASVPCSTVNKVCASGMKACTLGAQAIMLGLRDVVVVGGMESMSQAPHLSQSMRRGARMGSVVFTDAIQTDGLTDAFEDASMGDLAEECANEYAISRQDQDRAAAESYMRARDAIKKGKFEREIVGVEVPPARRGSQSELVTEDDEVVARAATYESLSKLRPCFTPVGSNEPTITAGNASTISDGAAAIVLMSRAKAEALGVAKNIRAVIRGFADAEQEPRRYTTSPSRAIPLALAHANVQLDDVDYFEINEAFSVVACANMKLLGINSEKVNVYGGAVAIGHPLGCSGARVIVTLISVLHQENGRIGCAAVCNGGGGATAIVIESNAKLNGQRG